MDDMERYGDYNELDEVPGGKKSPVGTIIKILIILVCLSVVGVLAFRMIAFRNYPDGMDSLYFTDALTEYYNKTGGNISVKTQNIEAKYDDPDWSNFYADKLFIIEETDELQITVRFNKSAIPVIEEKLGLSGLDRANPNLLSFKLAVYDDLTEGVKYLDANLEYKKVDTYLMYTYYKLAFSGVEADTTEAGRNKPGWIRLDIFVDGQAQNEAFSSIYIYENNDRYNIFSDYELEKGDRPE